MRKAAPKVRLVLKEALVQQQPFQVLPKLLVFLAAPMQQDWSNEEECVAVRSWIQVSNAIYRRIGDCSPTLEKDRQNACALEGCVHNRLRDDQNSA